MNRTDSPVALRRMIFGFRVLAPLANMGFQALPVAPAEFKALARRGSAEADRIAQRGARITASAGARFPLLAGDVAGGLLANRSFPARATALAIGSTASACAAEHGYADQAHLTHAFKEFSCLTPRAFVRQAGVVHGADRRLLAGRLVVVDAPPTAESTICSSSSKRLLSRVNEMPRADNQGA